MEPARTWLDEQRAMVLSTEAEFREAKSFGAVELGLQTLGKPERFARSR